MRVFAIAGNELRRLLRWRANIFFLFVLPMFIILLLGAVFGGSQKAKIGVLARDHGPLARSFVTGLAARTSNQLVSFATAGRLEHAVERGDVDAGLVVPANYDSQLRLGAQARLSFIGRPDSVAQQLRATVASVAAEQGRTLAAAPLIQRQAGIPFATALNRVERVSAAIPRVEVRLTDPAGAPYGSASGRFDQGASTELVLFIFLTSLTGAAFIIETRRLGVARRILSTPTSTGTLVAGQLLGRFAVALVQALIIVLGSLLFFGVSWGDPVGTAAVIVSFCLVATGAAVLVGSLCSTPQQAQPIALLLGLGLAALGGSMAPLEVFPGTARKIAHITPHAWANDAFSKLLKHGGDLITVLPQVGVLVGFAAAASGLAVWQLRRTLAST